jgi:hypothetical protein
MLYYFYLLLLLSVTWGKKEVEKGRSTTTTPPPDDPLAQVECEESEDGYIIPDPAQCDRYAECTPRGRLVLQLCPDGYALDLQHGVCDLASKVNCEGRTKQQAPTGTGLCPRLNGNFPLPPEVSCADYVDCREGQPFQMSCGHGAVFDDVLGCVHPDQTNRPGCTATDVLGFKCPAPGSDTTFGDHQRLPHPTDCSLFYACLSTGLPRLLGCTKPKVFNPRSGLCDDQKNVEGCEETYPDEPRELDIEAERSKLEAEIRAELEEKFGLRSSRQRAEPPRPATPRTEQPEPETPPPRKKNEVRPSATSPSPSSDGFKIPGGHHSRGQPSSVPKPEVAKEKIALRTRIASYDSAPAFLINPPSTPAPILAASSPSPSPTAQQAGAAASNRNLRPPRLLFSKPKSGL